VSPPPRLRDLKRVGPRMHPSPRPAPGLHPCKHPRLCVGNIIAWQQPVRWPESACAWLVSIARSSGRSACARSATETQRRG